MGRWFKKQTWILAAVVLLLLLTGIGVQAADSVEIAEIATFTDTLGTPLPAARQIRTRRLYSANAGADGTRGWYGSQLQSGLEQDIYDAIAQETKNLRKLGAVYAKSGAVTGSYVGLELGENAVTYNTNDTKNDANYQAWRKAYCRATHAYVRDYGDQYWTSSFAILLAKTETDGDYKTVKKAGFAPAEYYEGILEADVTPTDAALAQAVAKIGEEKTYYDKVKAAHDYAVELITYGNNTKGWAHTITGGLLGKYNYTAVCECYAKLFRLLCNENGIPCILIAGGSKWKADGTVDADHMWNYVQMDDGNWYLVDATWDDTLRCETYFLAGLNDASHTTGKTVGENHMAVGRFSEVAYEPFAVPVCSGISYEAAHAKVTLDESALTLAEGESEAVAAEYTFGSGSREVDYTYQSSNEKVATVDANGTVTAKKAGTAVITVKSRTKKDCTATCTVTVSHAHGKWVTEKAPTVLEEGVEIYVCAACGEEWERRKIDKLIEYQGTLTPAKTAVSLEVWQTEQFPEVTYRSEYGSREVSCSYASSNEAVATVDSKGRIIARKAGTAVITVMSETNLPSRANVTVTVKPHTHVPGEWQTVKAASIFADGSQKCVCTVCKETIETRKLAKITEGTKVTLTANKLPMQVKKSTSVLKIASCHPEDRVKEWASSKKSIVSVNKKTGKLTAKKKGKATITVKMESGAKASCVVTVQKGVVKTKKLSAVQKTLYLKKGESLTLSVKRTPISANDKLTYKSTKPKVVSVTKNGKLKAKKAGKAKITIRAASGKKLTLEVIVT